MSRNSLITLVLVSLLTAAAVGVSFYLTSSRTADEQNEAKQALFGTDEGQVPNYTDLDGNEVRLEDYLGQVLVINNWASWCPSCRNELPMIDSLAGEFADEEVAFLAINRAETKEQVERFMRSLPKMNVVVFILDPADHYYEATDGFAMPETIVYNKRGQIVYRKRGLIKEQELRVNLNTAIAAE